MNEKNPINTINEIYDLLVENSKNIKLLQKSVELLSAKVNGELFPGKPPAVLPPIVESSASTPKSSQSVLEPAKAEASAPATNSPRKSTRVFGSVRQFNKGISGVAITIRDTNNIVVKKTNTNAAGQWIAFLPAGVYTAEFIAPGSVPELRIIEITEGQKEIEIK